MKNRNLALLFFLIFATTTQGQYYNRGNYGTNKSVTVYSTKYTEHTTTFEKLIQSQNFKLLEKTANLYQTHYTFHVESSKSFYLDSILSSYGYITVSSMNKNNIDEKRKNLQGQIESQQQNIENAQFTLQQNAQDTMRSTERISNSNMQLQNNIRRFEQKIKEYERNIEELNQVKELMLVNIYIKDEISTPNGNNQNITWVNMPGVSYSYLMIENPKVGLTHEAYAGMNLKYLFTRGKSYIELGVLKPISPYSEIQLQDSALTSTKNDFFLVQFGQDFYTRHFGRGRRKYLNLYSGYTVGALIPNRYDDMPQKASLVSSLNIGLELFKSKHVLIDTKAAYFLPINNENRNTRGIMLTGAFNFVF
jgi:hypothetical protein